MDTEILFSCSHCSQPLTVEAAGAGMQVECPSCQQALTVPPPSTAAPSAASVRPPAAMPEREPGPSRSAGQLPARAGSPTRRDGSLPTRRGEGADPGLMARGAQAGAVQPIRGGWRVFCPECGQDFETAAAEAARGTTRQCLRCQALLDLLPGDPPQVRNRQGRSSPRELTVLPERHAEHDLRVALTGSPLTEDQLRAAAQRAREMAGVGVGWFWLRVVLLVLMLALMAFLIRQVIALHRPAPEALTVPAAVEATAAEGADQFAGQP